MPKELQRDEAARVQLDCASDDRVSGASFMSRPTGGDVFSCTVGPLGEDTVASLYAAAKEHAPVRLLFEHSSLLLDLQSLERKEPQAVRIVGKIIGKGAREHKA